MNLVEELAKIIFEYDGGLSRREYEEVMGKEKPLWSLSGEKFICNVSTEFTLAEHERDDYRLQAKKVIEFLQKRKLLKELNDE